MKCVGTAASTWCAAALVLLPSGACADPSAQPAVTHAMVRHPASGVEMPRISLPQRPDVERKVNAELDALAASLMCDEAGEDYTFDVNASVAHAGDDVFSVRVAYSAWCGGAYPVNYANASVTFDLRSGETVPFRKLFADYERNAPDIAAVFLEALSPEDLEGCDDALTVEELTGHHFAYVVSPKGLRLETAFPHVIAACDREATVPFDALRTFAAAEGILVRLAGAAPE